MIRKVGILKVRLDHFGFLAPFYERFISATMSEQLADLLDVPDNGVVLDAAGGTGRIAQFLCAGAAQIVVVDESRRMLREANRKPGIDPVCSHIEQLPFQDNSFDRILMVDALHHLANQQRASLELWRLLKPGGRIVIEEPDVRTFAVKLIAVAEKVALMRSHFLDPVRIAGLFPSKDACVSIKTDGPTAWVTIENRKRQPP